MRLVSRKWIEGLAEWAGAAEVVFGDGEILVKDEGVWRFADGREVRGSQRMVFGDGFVRVGEHRYQVVRSGDDFEAEYRCGEDRYAMWGQWPQKIGWTMQMRVIGPRKNEIQVVEYGQF